MSHTKPKKPTCATCANYINRSKNGECKVFPNFVARPNGTCGYHKPK